MSSKSMEGHFSFFYNRRRKQNIEERTGKQMTLLEVQNVKKIYTTRFGGNQVEALRNVNFSVEQREYVAIMGESGSGKTTLLNILAALDRPTGGKVYLKGRDLSGVKEREMAAFRRQNLGFVFQDFNLLDSHRWWRSFGSRISCRNTPMKCRVDKNSGRLWQEP